MQNEAAETIDFLLNDKRLDKYSTFTILGKGTTIYAGEGDAVVRLGCHIINIDEWLKMHNIFEHLTTSVRKSGVGQAGIPHLGLNLIVVGPQHDLYITRHAQEVMSWEQGHWPKSIHQITALEYGIILIAGLNNSGRSMLAAALLEEIAQRNKISWSCDVKMQYKSPLIIPYETGQGNTFATPQHAIWAAMNATAVKAINVGNIADADTARISYDCAGTGKIVLGTIAAPTATEALRTLYNWGIHQQTVAASTHAIVAIRLPMITFPGGETRLQPLTEAIIPSINMRQLLENGDIDNIRQRISSTTGGWDFAADARAIAESQHIPFDAINKFAK